MVSRGDMDLKTNPGTYTLILQSHLDITFQAGGWGQLPLQPGYYVYVGSAFGSGGLRARLSRHLRTDKRKHWYIDYLREHVTPVESWVSYETEHLEHTWAGILSEKPGLILIQGFRCSDCNCQSHLFFTTKMPGNNWFRRVERLIV